MISYYLQNNPWSKTEWQIVKIDKHSINNILPQFPFLSAQGYDLPFVKTVPWPMEIFVMEHNTYIPQAESYIPEVNVEVNYKSFLLLL